MEVHAVPESLFHIECISLFSILSLRNKENQTELDCIKQTFSFNNNNNWSNQQTIYCKLLKQSAELREQLIFCVHNSFQRPAKSSVP